jgi:hypothetical protein
MTPGQVNLVCPQGSTFRKTLSVLSDDQPIDFTGYSSRMQVRETYFNENTILDLMSSNGDLFMGGSAGTIDIFVNDSKTSSLPAGEWVYDLEVESSGGIVNRIIEGVFYVTPEVTR